MKRALKKLPRDQGDIYPSLGFGKSRNDLTSRGIENIPDPFDSNE